MISDLTLFSCEVPEHSELLHGFLTNWARSGLLDGDLTFVHPRVGEQPWTVTPLLFADREHHAVNPVLTSALAARDYRTVRVVKVSPVGRSAPATSVERELADLRDEIRGRLQGGRAEVRLINLVLPLGEVVRGVPDDALSTAADLNVIAVPEDQKGTGFATEPIPEEAAYIAWAGAVAATLVGAWAGVPSGPLDARPKVMAQARPVAVVARSFLRLIDGGFLVDHLGAGLVGRFDEWPVPAGVDGGADLVGRRPDALAQLARQFAHEVDNGALCFNRVPQKVQPPKTPLKWWMAFVLMFRFIGNALRNAPTNFLRGQYDKVRDRAAAWVGNVTVGKDSMYLVTFAGRGGGRDVGEAGDVPRTVEELRGAADRITGLLGHRNPPSAAPEAWRAFRQALFSLADGGPLPRPLDEEDLLEGTRRLLVRSAVQLAPDPEGAPLVLYQGLYAAGEPLAPWARSGAHPCDPLGCREMDQALARASGQIEQELVARGGGVPGAVLPQPPPPSASGEVEAEESPQAVVDPIERRATLYSQARAAIREWVRARRQSFAWLVGEVLADELSAAISEYLRAMEIVMRGRPDGAKRDARRARRRLLLQWFFTFIMLVVLVVAGWKWLGLALGLLIGVAIPLQIILMFVAFLGFQREMFRLQYRERKEQLEYDYAEESVVQSSGEIVKLLDRYSEYLDWGLALGKFVHRPWGDPPESVLAGDELSLEHLPRAVVSAAGFIAEADVRGLRAKALREIIRRSWLTNLFSPIRQNVLEGLAREQGVQPDEITSPEADRSAERTNSRRALRDHLLKGSYSDAARREFERIVVGFCLGLQPAEVFEYAEIGLREHDEPTEPEAPGLVKATDAVHLEPVQGARSTGPIDVPSVARAALDTVVHLHVETADGGATGSGVIVRPDGKIVTNAHVVDGAQRVVVEFADGSAAEADVLLQRPDQDLAVVQARCKTPSVARVRTDVTAVIGESVVAIGNPLGQRGGPSVSVGIVSATGREGQFESAFLTDMIQTDAAISPGSSGGGLFDGAAQVIGITTGGAPRGENIGFAIPIARAFELLDGSLSAKGSGSGAEDDAAGGGVDDDQASAAAQVSTQDLGPRSRQKPRYHDIDRFFREIEPDAERTELFGAGLWTSDQALEGMPVLHESFVWHPDGAAFQWAGKTWPNGTSVHPASITPPVALGRRLVFAAVRLDFSKAGTTSDFTLFSPGPGS